MTPSPSSLATELLEGADQGQKSGRTGDDENLRVTRLGQRRSPTTTTTKYLGRYILARQPTAAERTLQSPATPGGPQEFWLCLAAVVVPHKTRVRPTSERCLGRHRRLLAGFGSVVV